MGCQKEIVEQVVTGGGDCVIAVKDNQPKLLAAIQAFFLDHLERDLEDLRYRCHETLDDGHGRIDERSYYLAKVPRDFAVGQDWPWVKAIGYAVRITRHADGTGSDEVRYYLSSRYPGVPPVEGAMPPAWRQHQSPPMRPAAQSRPRRPSRVKHA